MRRLSKASFSARKMGCTVRSGVVSRTAVCHWSTERDVLFDESSSEDTTPYEFSV